jgi:hypothetical protein
LASAAGILSRGAAVFYPKGLPQAKELEYAASHLTSIEISATFYGSQKPESLANGPPPCLMASCSLIRSSEISAREDAMRKACRLMREGYVVSHVDGPNGERVDIVDIRAWCSAHASN